LYSFTNIKSIMYIIYRFAAEADKKLSQKRLFKLYVENGSIVLITRLFASKKIHLSRKKVACVNKGQVTMSKKMICVGTGTFAAFLTFLHFCKLPSRLGLLCVAVASPLSVPVHVV
jgi:hypothetical protein